MGPSVEAVTADGVGHRIDASLDRPQLADDAPDRRRIAECDGSVGDITDDDRTGADQASGSDAHEGQNRDVDPECARRAES